MKKYLTLSVIALIIALALDFVWIGFIANSFYITQYGPLYTAHPVLWAAAIWYVIYALGLVYFAIQPALRSGTIRTAALRGAFLALVAFGTYDLTSLAVTVNWPIILSVVDMSYGIFGGAVISALTYWIAKKYVK
jgi:uncharacterized membrane protein